MLQYLIGEEIPRQLYGDLKRRYGGLVDQVMDTVRPLVEMGDKDLCVATYALIELMARMPIERVWVVLARLNELSVGVKESEDPEVCRQRLEALAIKQSHDRPVTELAFSVRALHCLESDNIRFVGELVARTEAGLLAIKNFGRHTLVEVKQVLAVERLALNTDVGLWRRPA